MLHGQPDRVVVGGPSDAVWLPVITAVIQAVAVSVLVTLLVLITGAGLDVELALLLGGAWAILVLAGLAQSVFWRIRLAPVTYNADQFGITVLKAGKLFAHWRWADVDLISVTGRIGWRELLVYRSGAESFPRLVVGSKGSLTRCPNVLLFGHPQATTLENSLRALLSAARNR